MSVLLCESHSTKRGVVVQIVLRVPTFRSGRGEGDHDRTPHHISRETGNCICTTIFNSQISGALRSGYDRAEILSPGLQGGDVSCFKALESFPAENEWASSVPVQLGLSEISAQYSGYRKIKGDGHCYYRSLVFSLLERFVLMMGGKIPPSTLSERFVSSSAGDGESIGQDLQRDDAMVDLGRAHLEKFRRDLDKAPDEFWQQEIVEGNVRISQRVFLQQTLDRWLQTPWDELVDIFYSDVRTLKKLDLALVSAVRAMLANYIMAHLDEKLNFGMTIAETLVALGWKDQKGDVRPDSYLGAKVLLYNGEGAMAEELILELAPRALGHATRIVHLSAETGVNDVLFGSNGASSASTNAENHVVVDLLYSDRKGRQHYDILYGWEVGRIVREAETRTRELCVSPEKMAEQQRILDQITAKNRSKSTSSCGYS